MEAERLQIEAKTEVVYLPFYDVRFLVMVHLCFRLLLHLFWNIFIEVNTDTHC